MADAVSSTKKINIPEGMPPAYQNALLENSKLVEELFCSGDGGSEAELEQLQNLLHFLDVFIEVFNNPAKQLLNKSATVVAVVKGDSPVIRECITKYREIYRRHFRGVKYLPVTKFNGISEQAEAEIWRCFKVLTSATTSQSCQEKENDLRRLLNLEKFWLEKVNGQRRSEDLENIKTEIVDKFKEVVQTTFPYLVLDEESAGSSCKMKYCEDIMLQRKLKTLVEDAKKEFHEHIPFNDQESPEVCSSICSELGKKLEETVVEDVKLRNSCRRSVIQSYMESMVENSVEKYKEAIDSVIMDELATVQMKMERISSAHKKFVDDFTPKFVNSENGLEIEIGSAEYQVHCLNNYNNKTYEIFKELIPVAVECSQTNLKDCERKVREEVEDSLKRITDIFCSHGMASFAPGFKSHVESGLGTIFTHLKDANQVTSRTMIDIAKPNRILTKDEITLSSKLDIWKEYYVDMLVSCLRDSNKFLAPVNEKLLDKCHEKARWLVFDNIQEECGYSVLGPKVEEEFCQFADNYIALVKINKQFFIDQIGAMQPGTPVPFSPVVGKDHEVVNGKSKSVPTRHQCLTCMPEYHNKSFEELQLEDREKRRAIPLSSLKFPVAAPTFSMLASGFNFQLKLSPSSNDFTFPQSPPFTNTSTTSPPSASSSPAAGTTPPRVALTGSRKLRISSNNKRAK